MSSSPPHRQLPVQHSAKLELPIQTNSVADNRLEFQPQPTLDTSKVIPPVFSDNSETVSRYSERVTWLAVLGLGLYLSVLSDLPFPDFPNHISRAAAISQLLWNDGSNWASHYSFALSFTPYIACDLFLAVMMRVVEPATAGSLAFAAAYISLPLATKRLLTSSHAPSETHPTLIALSAVVGSNWFFLSGFFNFQVGVSLALVAIAAVIDERGFSLRDAILFALLVAAVYLTHLAAFVVLGVFVATYLSHSLLLRSRIWMRAFLASAPFCAIGVFHGVRMLTSQPAKDEWVWRTVSGKILAFASPIYRFSLPWDVAISVLLLVALWLAIRLPLSRSTFDSMARSGVVVGGASCILLYLILPVAGLSAWDVDNRALPFAFLLIPIGLSSVAPPQSRHSRLAGSVALVAVLLNVLAVAVPARQINAQSHQYRSLGCDGLKGVRVLPVATQMLTGRIRPLLHEGSFLEMDCGALTPYTFRGDNGGPMSFFRRVSPPTFIPDLFWYVRDGSIDMSLVEQNFDAVVITKPFVISRLKPLRLALVRENSAAALFQIVKQ